MVTGTGTWSAWMQRPHGRAAVRHCLPARASASGVPGTCLSSPLRDHDSDDHRNLNTTATGGGGHRDGASARWDTAARGHCSNTAMLAACNSHCQPDEWTTTVTRAVPVPVPVPVAARRLAPPLTTVTAQVPAQANPQGAAGPTTPTLRVRLEFALHFHRDRSVGPSTAAINHLKSQFTIIKGGTQQRPPTH